MQRLRKNLVFLVSLACATGSAHAADIDSLRGRYAFDWHIAPDKTRCAGVDDRLLALFKSNAFACNMKTVTNTASGQPAVVCTKKSGGAEYLIFSSKKSCDLERQTQISNGD